MKKHNQKDVFLNGEGDAYFSRNRTALSNDEAMAKADPVLPVLAGLHPFPKRVLEVGCANGWRLHRMRTLGAEQCCGLDPSSDAVASGAKSYPKLLLQVGTADTLPFDDNAFDLVVFGFCLYLCDPSQHFRIVAEADRVLANGGHLVVFDFDPPAPYRNAYTHRPGIFSHKFDYSRLFLAHPHYRLREKRVAGHGPAGTSLLPDDRVAVSLMIKDPSTAWPMNPWKA
jgi:ubiquinone/menaquinone biosynthesis C-methylase UbiE